MYSFYYMNDVLFLFYFPLFFMEEEKRRRQEVGTYLEQGQKLSIRT